MLTHEPTIGRIKRRTKCVVLVAGAALALAACSSSAGAPSKKSTDTGSAVAVAKNAAAAAKVPAAIVKRGELTVAMDVSSPPNHFYASDGKTLIGLDPDIAKLLGQTLGLKIKLVGVNFDEIIPGMAAGKYDLAIAQMSPTTDREKVLGFVDYVASGTALAVKKGNPAKMSIDTMCGKKIAVLKGSFQQAVRVPGYSTACTKAGKAAIVASAFPDQQATVLALTSGRVDGVMEDSPVLGYAQKQGAPIEVVGVAHTSAVGIGVPKDSGLLDPVQAAMTYLLTTPEYKATLATWGASAGAITKALVNDNG